MPWGKTTTVTHDDSKGRAIRQGALFLRALSLPQDSPSGVLTPWVLESTNPSSQRVAPLEHVVHPEGHVARKKHKLASGTLGAHGASWRACHMKEMKVSEWHPWSMRCILTGTPHKRNNRREWHPWSTWCVLKGTSHWCWGRNKPRWP